LKGPCHSKCVMLVKRVSDAAATASSPTLPSLLRLSLSLVWFRADDSVGHPFFLLHTKPNVFQKQGDGQSCTQIHIFIAILSLISFLAHLLWTKVLSENFSFGAFGPFSFSAKSDFILVVQVVDLLSCRVALYYCVFPANVKVAMS